MDAAEYKHVVLGLIFLKYISDTFEDRHAELLTKVDEGYDPEHPEEYQADNIFWVPVEARWLALQAGAKQPVIGKLIDDAMIAIEKHNPKLKGVLPTDFNRVGLDKQRLGVDLSQFNFAEDLPTNLKYLAMYVRFCHYTARRAKSLLAASV